MKNQFFAVVTLAVAPNGIGGNRVALCTKYQSNEGYKTESAARKSAEKTFGAKALSIVVCEFPDYEAATEYLYTVRAIVNPENYGPEGRRTH